MISQRVFLSCGTAGRRRSFEWFTSQKTAGCRKRKKKKWQGEYSKMYSLEGKWICQWLVPNEWQKTGTYNPFVCGIIDVCSSCLPCVCHTFIHTHVNINSCCRHRWHKKIEPLPFKKKKINCTDTTEHFSSKYTPLYKYVSSYNGFARQCKYAKMESSDLRFIRFGCKFSGVIVDILCPS